MKRVMSKRVLVTGSSRGIGKEVALTLGRNGFEIIVHCRAGEQQAQEVVSEIVDAGGKAHYLKFDIADRAQTRAELNQEIEKNGALYGLVCNAGVTRDNAFPSMEDDEWDQVIRTNLDGFYNVTQPVVMPMVRLKQGGRIVVMSSVSGLVGNRGQVNYSATKAGLIGASKALAVELAKRKITVNCVAPGLIDTDMVSDELLTEALKMIPARRMGTVKEVAGLVEYLFSESAAYITRQVISVNGGMT